MGLKVNYSRLVWISVFIVCGAAAGAFTGRYVLSFVYSGAIIGCLWALWLVIKAHYLGHCPDCGAKPGEIHDFGCDIEECPRCHRQLMTCECWTRDADEDIDTLASDEDDPVEELPDGLIQAGRIPFGSESRFSDNSER
jgi:hypothetical protein